MKLWKILGVELYEVGDVIITSSSNNPGSRFKGTWSLIAQGMAIVGVKLSDTDFNVVNKTGGSKTHTLTQAQLPLYNLKGLKWSNGFPITFDGGTAGNGYKLTYDYNTYNPGQVEGFQISSGGSNQPHSIQSPYITKYIWERVS